MKLAKALVLVFVLSSFAFMPTCSAIGDKVRAFVGQALEITSGFDRPIIGGDVRKAEELYQEYKGIYDGLQQFLANPPQNTWREEINCVSYAGTIVNLRRATLLDYIIMVEAYQAGRTEDYNKMLKVLHQDYDDATYHRREFKKKYGF